VLAGLSSSPQEPTVCFNLFFTPQILERHAGTIFQGHRASQQLTVVEMIVSAVMEMGAGRISSKSWH